MNDETLPRSFRDVVDLWPSRAMLGEDVDVPATQVRVWHHQNRIPRKKFEAVAAAARRRGFSGVTFASLSKFWRDRKAVL